MCATLMLRISSSTFSYQERLYKTSWGWHSQNAIAEDSELIDRITEVIWPSTLLLLWPFLLAPEGRQ
jgi:hypothetical protein